MPKSLKEYNAYTKRAVKGIKKSIKEVFTSPYTSGTGREKIKNKKISPSSYKSPYASGAGRAKMSACMKKHRGYGLTLSASQTKCEKILESGKKPAISKTGRTFPGQSVASKK